jgi:glucose/arabinose dehydrogenase
MGIERPFDVKFGPDGAMYIVDFGQHLIVLKHIEYGHLPFEWPERTGVIWKVTKK